MYAYVTLRNNCKRRGVVFGLSFKQFLAFAVKTEYMHKKGTGKTSLHIDRVNQTNGYFASNIQALTNSANVKKYIEWSRNEKGKSEFKTRKKLNLDDGMGNYPF
jgi:hypothetical protein